MNCQNRISYLIRQGDTLYNIAAHYGTTVENILTSNPHLNIYNLRIGELITFCIDKDIADINNMYPTGGTNEIITSGDQDNDYVITLPELDLNNDIRMFLTQHCFWIRMLMISITEELKDVSEINARILRITKNISSMYRNYYGNAAAGNMERLLSNHLRLNIDLINAYKNKDGQESELDRRKYSNIDELASLLSGMNPFHTFDEIQGLFIIQFDLFKKMLNMHLTGNHSSEIAAFDNLEQQALVTAELLTNGMVNQFPDAFF